MNTKLFNALTAFILFLLPGMAHGQTAPNLGTAANFVLFTTVGAVTNSGIPHLTHLTGNVASNSGSSTGFGNVDGVMDDGTVASAQCSADLLSAYLQLNSAVPTFFPSSSMGNGDTLVPGIYYIPAAATLNLNLVLNAQGNPDAVFIFQIQGSFSTSAASKVNLINGAVACNVFWKVEGLVSMAAGTTMRGTIVAHNAAINMDANDTLEGRALSINGAITTNAILAYTPLGCGSPVLTGPAAPALASTAAYGVFSSIGPVTNTGITYVTGDVGTNSGLTTGFDSLFVTGMIHPVPDASTATCAGDLANVYNYLNTLTPDINLLYPAQFGNDLVLTPHTYHMGAVLTFTGSIYLNAEGNSNAIFVLQVNGAFSTSTFSKVILINGAQAKNVYWKIDGAVHIYDNSVFNGTIVAAGAITLNNADTLSGRILTINGAVNINGDYVAIASDSTCVAPVIGGIESICAGSTTALSDSASGGTWASIDTAVATIDTSGIVTGITPGTSVIRYTSPAGCIRTTTVTVNTAPAPITGPGSVCVGSSITLSDTSSGGDWSSSNMPQATVGTSSGIVTGIANGTPAIIYTISNGCTATKTIIVGIYAGNITGHSNVCRGSSIILTDTITGGAWSASNVKAIVIGGLVTGFSAGIDTVVYTVSNLCGTDTAIKIVTIDTFRNAGAITGPSSICMGSSITLTDSVAGGMWSSSNARALVAGGLVTGVAAGLDTIRYVIANSCGIDTATKIITVNQLPNAGNIIGSSSVCVGAVTTLVDGAPGGIWNSSNATATVSGGLVTGVTSGIDTISYLVSNTCGTNTATKIMTVNPLPDAGVIMGLSSVCVGSSITLTDGVAGGIWSSSNTTATVFDGVVTGIDPGTDTAWYAITNMCGTDTAAQAITVNPLSDAGNISGPSGVCVGSVITLTDTVTGGAWSSSNTTAMVVDGVVTGIAAGTDSVIYTVTDICNTSMAIYAVIVNPLPLAPAITTQAPSSACTGTMYQNYGAAILPPADVSYYWSATNATVWAQGASDQYSLINFSETGTAYVTLTATIASTGCISQSTLTINVGDGVAQTPEVVYFNNHFVCTPSNEGSYQWGYDNIITLDSTLLVGEVNQDYLNESPDFANNYYWAMTTSGGCLQKTYYIVPSTAVQNVNANTTAVSIYPNPANSFINVDVSGAVNGVVKVDVFNMVGQKINTVMTRDNKAAIDVTTLSAGSYLITCYRDGIKITGATFIKN